MILMNQSASPLVSETKMSAAMSSQKYFLLVICSLFALFVETYKLVDVEIDLNPGGEPPKIFTKESLAEFDASDVCF